MTTDQRGFPRPGADGTSCDIGAVEIGTGPSAASTTTNLNSSANPSAPGQQVTFTATVSPPPSSGTVEFKDGDDDPGPRHHTADARWAVHLLDHLSVSRSAFDRGGVLGQQPVPGFDLA